MIDYISYPGFVFIKFDIPRKPVYLSFDWCLICYICFTGACAGWVNWGQCQKGKVAKLIGLYGKCMLCQVWAFLLWVYARVPTAHSLRRNPQKLLRQSMHFLYNPINFATFPFWHCPNLLTLHAPQWNNPTNKASIKRQINRLSISSLMNKNAG